MMSEHSDKKDIQDRDEVTVARLLRLAGPANPIPADIEARVFARVEREWKASSTPPDESRVYRAVHRAWNRTSRFKQWTRWMAPLAVAASALLVMTIMMQPESVTPSVVPIATVAKVIGDTGTGQLPQLERKIYPGETLSTGAGEGISLLLANAESLRVDENTTMRMEDGHRFSLLSGRVYADTGDFMYHNRKLVIDTPHGSVTDIGTQFSVAASTDSLDVAVREGRVDIAREREALTAVAGERVQLSSNNEVAFDRLEPHDPYWDWASSLAPSYNMENRSLLEFLRWAARETGRELVFENQELRMEAMRVDLHGSVSDFEPLEAVASVLATTSFKYRIEPDKIIIVR